MNVFLPGVGWGWGWGGGGGVVYMCVGVVCDHCIDRMEYIIIDTCNATQSFCKHVAEVYGYQLIKRETIFLYFVTEGLLVQERERELENFI